MYVCICKAVTCGQIRQAVREGADTRRRLRECLGVGAGCGKCRADVGELLERQRPRPQAARPEPLAA